MCGADSKVICTASVEERVPLFREDLGKGWLTERVFHVAPCHSISDHPRIQQRQSRRTDDGNQTPNRAQSRSVISTRSVGRADYLAGLYVIRRTELYHYRLHHRGLRSRDPGDSRAVKSGTLTQCQFSISGSASVGIREWSTEVWIFAMKKIPRRKWT